MLRSTTTAERVTTSDQRAQALSVLRQTYADEKGWVGSAEDVFPEQDLSNSEVTWVLATVDDAPAGVLRVHYAPPLDVYASYGLRGIGDGEPVDGGSHDPEPTISIHGEALDADGIQDFIHENQIAEIGRFAVLPAYRRRIRVVFWLMRIACVDTFERRYTHYVTDVFDGEEHSPYNFHTRVLGFEPLATHAVGEMDCLHRRITMVLDLGACYRRLARKKNRLFRFLSDGLSRSLQDEILGREAAAA